MGWKRISKHRAFQKEVSLLGMVWGGRREEGSGWGTHVYLWWIHLDIWQNQYNIVKFKNKIKFKKRKKERKRSRENEGTASAAGRPPDRPGRASSFHGLVSMNFYSLKTKKIPAGRLGLGDRLGCYRVFTGVCIFA